MSIKTGIISDSSTMGKDVTTREISPNHRKSSINFEAMIEEISIQHKPAHYTDLLEEAHKGPISDNFPQPMENELDLKLGLDGNESKERYKQLLYDYYLKCEDLENKCTILHRNLQEVKDAWDRAKVLRDNALKEKENMTIKYATGERKVIAERQLREKTEKRFEELLKENKILQHKLQTVTDEKSRICIMYDNKVHEQKVIQSENDRIKNDNCILENELKLCQNALRNHAEQNRTSQKNIEELKEKLQHYSEEVEEAKRKADETIRLFKHSEENQAYILDKEVKEQQTLLILIKHERDENEKQVKNLKLYLARSKCENEEISRRNEELTQKIQQLELEKIGCSKKLNELEGTENQHLEIESDLNMKSAPVVEYAIQLSDDREKMKISNEMIDFFKTKNSDLEEQIETSKNREAELLLFTQQLTDRNVQLQSRFSNIENENKKFACEQRELKKAYKKCESHCEVLLEQLCEEKDRRSKERNDYFDEIECLRKNLSKQTLQLKEQQLHHRGEIAVIKRKYNFSMREVQKELHHWRSIGGDRSCYPSSTSLFSNYSERSNKPGSNEQVEVIQPENQLNSQALIERLVRLQRISARKSEKIDFLEDQINTLIFELQKKSKLLQIYMLREQSGTLTSDKEDDTKEGLAKLTGVMASIYGGKIADKHLTLELLLDINRKLQEVLEDSLLKNIILKNSVDSLGEEIDRLKNEQIKS